MSHTNKILYCLLLAMFLFSSSLYGQGATRKLSKKQQAYSKGFDIPYPAGLMGNFIWMKQGIVIENMQLGITSENVDLPLSPVDFIGFGTNTNTSYAGKKSNRG